MLLAKQPKYVGAVIGAGFGDEGKGLTTDYLIREHGRTGTKLVIRFNGGPQAGHTVETDEGKRHVFSHFGSGTFAGANTYFSKFCSVNPLLFNEEHDKLKKLVGSLPMQLVSHLCQVTTPWDMIMNQNVEKQRRKGEGHHGSTGLGVGVTEDRRLKELETPIGYLSHLSRNGMRHEFHNIRDRIYDGVYDFMGHKLEKKILTNGELRMFTEKRMVDKFLDAFELMLERVGVVFMGKHTFDYDTIVFEGAQGLLLDERYGVSPFVTWSNTGAQNVVALCNEMGMHLDEIVYVTRSFGTRHGEGPIYDDVSGLASSFPIHVEDKTNVENEWQGRIRTFPLDEKRLCRVCYDDSILAENDLFTTRRDTGKDIKTSLMVTWAHLLDDPSFGTRHVTYDRFNKAEWLEDIQATYLAMGKTASSVIKL